MTYTDGFFLGRSSWRNSVVCSNDIFDHLHISRKVVNPWSRVYKQDHLVTFGSIRDLRYDYYRFSFWPEGQLDGLPVKGLALGDYTLMPLWIWIYCLIWWFIQVPRNKFDLESTQLERHCLLRRMQWRWQLFDSVCLSNSSSLSRFGFL